MSLPQEFSIFLVCAWIYHMQKGCLSFIYYYYFFVYSFFFIDVIWSLFDRQETI